MLSTEEAQGREDGEEEEGRQRGEGGEARESEEERAGQKKTVDKGEETTIEQCIRRVDKITHDSSSTAGIGINRRLATVHVT